MRQMMRHSEHSRSKGSHVCNITNVKLVDAIIQRDNSKWTEFLDESERSNFAIIQTIQGRSFLFAMLMLLKLPSTCSLAAVQRWHFYVMYAMDVHWWRLRGEDFEHGFDTTPDFLLLQVIHCEVLNPLRFVCNKWNSICGFDEILNMFDLKRNNYRFILTTRWIFL